MDDYLWDREVMRAYCDCSVSHSWKAFGIAAAVVHDGSVIVRSRKAYDRSMRLLPTQGELQALLYAIEQTTALLTNALHMPSHVVIFSDVDHIAHLLSGGDVEIFADTARRVAAARTSFVNRWPTVDLNICYLPPEEQKHNPYYTAAHNAARREVSTRRE